MTKSGEKAQEEMLVAIQSHLIKKGVFCFRST
jgi:hypothetical protein